MIALLLAAAVAGSPPIEDSACAERDLQLMLVAPARESAKNRMELDRRLAAVLYDERQIEPQATPHHRGPLVERGLPIALALGGLALVALAVARRSRLSAALGCALLLGAGALAAAFAIGPEVAAREAQRRVAAMRACRFRLLETRSLLEHGELARCLDDVGEAQEDLLGWEAMLRNGGQLDTARVVKLRNELAHRN